MAAPTTIAAEFVMLEPTGEAMRTWQMERTQWMAQGRFVPAGQTQDTLVYGRKYTPGWAVIVAIFLFPIGLLALLARTSEQLTLRFQPRGTTETLVTVTGAMSNAPSYNLMVALINEYNENASGSYQQGQAAQDNSESDPASP
jgi:hypothetical protein